MDFFQFLDPFTALTAVVDEVRWWHIAIVVADYILKFLALGWVPKDRRPTSAMAWLLAIFLLPFIGFLLFFLMGSPYINRRRHRIQDEANEAIRMLTSEEPDVPVGATLSEELLSLVHLNRTLTAIPAVDGTLHKLHSTYDQTIARMAEVIDEAESYVHVEIYIMSWDETTDVFFQALKRAAARGVTVKVLYDHIGSLKYKGSKRLEKRLRELGIDCYVMLPLRPFKWRFRRPDLRNHRKLVVVDGRVAFIGSQNLIEAEYGDKKNHRIGRRWTDIMAELTGPIITTVDSVFAADWYAEADELLELVEPAKLKQMLDDADRDTGAEIMQLIPSGPGFQTEPNLRLFTSMAHHAKERLVLVSPYFIPDESLMEAVTTACYRGVKVELYVSEKSDQVLVGHAQASYYEELLRAGVEMYLYPAPKVLHSKFAIADNDMAIMGSSNMDMRSFGLNYEISLMVGTGEVLEELKKLTEEYRGESALLTAEQWATRPWYKQYLDNLARLTSALQ